MPIDGRIMNQVRVIVDESGRIIGYRNPVTDVDEYSLNLTESGGAFTFGTAEGVLALSEAVAVVSLTATGTAFTGACEFRGFVVRAETGGTADVTIYDATSATGTAIMTVANISTGTYYWDGDHATPGVGNGGRRLNATGCHVVIAGTCTIDVMVS